MRYRHVTRIKLYVIITKNAVLNEASQGALKTAPTTNAVEASSTTAINTAIEDKSKVRDSD